MADPPFSLDLTDYERRIQARRQEGDVFLPDVARETVPDRFVRPADPAWRIQTPEMTVDMSRDLGTIRIQVGDRVLLVHGRDLSFDWRPEDRS